MKAGRMARFSVSETSHSGGGVVSGLNSSDSGTREAKSVTLRHVFSLPKKNANSKAGQPAQDCEGSEK